MAKTVYLSGVASWAQLYENNRDLTYECTSLDLSMDAESFEKFKESGITNKIRETNFGENTVKLRRPWTHASVPEWGGAPSVINVDNEPMTDLIGNGSKVTVKLTVYESRRGVGSRVETVRVDELVPYEKPAEQATQDDSEDFIPF